MFKRSNYVLPGVESLLPCPTFSQLPISSSEIPPRKDEISPTQADHQYGQNIAACPQPQKLISMVSVSYKPVLSDRQLLARLSVAYPTNKFRHPRRTH